MRDREHGGPHGMTVDHAADVVECAIARQMQRHLRRRRPALLTGQHAALGVDEDEVVECHVPVVDQDGVTTRLPSSRLAETLPAVPST